MVVAVVVVARLLLLGSENPKGKQKKLVFPGVWPKEAEEEGREEKGKTERRREEEEK